MTEAARKRLSFALLLTIGFIFSTAYARDTSTVLKTLVGHWKQRGGQVEYYFTGNRMTFIDPKYPFTSLTNERYKVETDIDLTVEKYDYITISFPDSVGIPGYFSTPGSPTKPKPHALMIHFNAKRTAFKLNMIINKEMKEGKIIFDYIGPETSP